MIHDINTAILVHRTICGEAIREAIYERGNSQSNCKTVAIDEYLAVSFSSVESKHKAISHELWSMAHALNLYLALYFFVLN